MGGGKVGLFDKPGNPAGLGLRNRVALADIAVTGFRLAGGDAEGDQIAALRAGKACGHRLLEGGQVVDQMVGGKNQENRIIALGQGLKGGNGHRRRGIAANRLEKDRGLGPDGPQLLGDHETMFTVTDHQRRNRTCHPGKPIHRILQQGSRIDQRQQLFGIQRSGKGPEPGAGATRQNHRHNA